MYRRVLIVDDEPLILEFTAAMLDDLDCEVVTAAGGEEALEKLETDERIEVLITDIQMPGLDGYELAEKAQSQRPELQVIFCSGRAQSGNGLPLLQKPFTQEDLARLMARTTGQRR
jgi:CheY-like chemotaxis protein